MPIHSFNPVFVSHQTRFGQQSGVSVPQPEVSVDLLRTLQKLPFDLDRYFTRDEKTIEIPMHRLSAIRAREDGIRNANKYMRMAYDGQMDKRKPISLKDNGDGSFSVRDGNSTYFNGLLSGWNTILGRVLTDEEFALEQQQSA